MLTRLLLLVVVGFFASPAWASCTEVDSGTGGSSTGSTGTAVVSDLDMTGANLILWVVTSYDASSPTASHVSDSSGNTWTATAYTSSQDANSHLTTYRAISPMTSASQDFTFTPSGGVGLYPGAIVIGLNCSAVPTFSNAVQASLVHPQATMQAGSIGAAGQVVFEFLYHGYDALLSIDGGFPEHIDNQLVLGNSIGIAGTWKDVDGAVNPTWTPFPNPTPYIAVAEAFDVGVTASAMPLLRFRLGRFQ